MVHVLVMFAIWLPHIGCMPQAAPERLPVYNSVEEAASTSALRFHLNLNDQGLSALPEGLTGLASVERLGLRGNQFGELDPAIGDVRDLVWLDLGRAGVVNLPDTIGRLDMLATLYLSDNALTHLPNGVAGMKALRYLNLDRNRLQELPPSIGELSALRWLRLNHNALTELPDAIAELTSLERLYLSHNQLEALPDDIAKLQNLEWLLLEGNPLPAEERERIAQALPHCTIIY